MKPRLTWNLERKRCRGETARLHRNVELLHDQRAKNESARGSDGVA